MTAHQSEQLDPARRAAARWSPHDPGMLAGLRAVVVLAGAMRRSPLRRAAGRCMLNLPVTSERTILDCWRDQITALAKAFQFDRLPVRVMIDQATPCATQRSWPGPVDLHIERDPLAYRGTGGLLRDVTEHYGDNELILVAQAPQLLLDPLPPIAEALATTDGDVRLLTRHDGSPGGIMLMRCGVLRQIPAIGFIDLKEQALPSIAEAHRVTATRWRGRAGVPIRTMSGYLDALRAYHRQLRDLPITEDPLHEDWQPTFRILEQGAIVDKSAVVHDSVILRDAVIGSGSVIVRSVVGGGGLVATEESVVDRVVSANDCRARW